MLEDNITCLGTVTIVTTLCYESLELVGHIANHNGGVHKWRSNSTWSKVRGLYFQGTSLAHDDSRAVLVASKLVEPVPVGTE